VPKEEDSLAYEHNLSVSVQKLSAIIHWSRNCGNI